MAVTNPVQYLDDSLELCQRCKVNSAVLISRKEKFCGECFVFFMRGKQRKQMLDERYKVKYGKVLERLGEQRVLLPVSFGISSLTLLDMIASLLQEQNLAHKGKQGFQLVVLYLKENSEDADKITKSFEELAQKYQPVDIKFMIINIDNYNVGERLKTSVSNEFHVLGQKLSTLDPAQHMTVSQLLDMSPSRSLRADLQALVYEDIIFRTAITEECQTILFGHSMTRLATEVISLTVKGRGQEIHRAIADGPRTFDKHTIHVIYPLRDILYAEVHAVLKLSGDLSSYVQAPAEQQTKLVKNMTVQALTSQYFANLDATGYASTASTVVKTAEKLGGPKEPKVGQCQVCGGDIHQDPQLWLRNITVATAAPLETDDQREYAKKYHSQLHTEEVPGQHLSVCYGCTTTLSGAGSGFVWPVKSAEVTKQEIIDEYVLTDDE